MSLFPECKFALVAEGGVLRAGQTNRGVVELDVSESITNAAAMAFRFQTIGKVKYPGDETETVLRNALMTIPLRSEFPQGLAAGLHRVPFSLDLPWNLPGAISVDGATITHEIQLYLDVAWSFDHSATFEVYVRPAAVHGAARRPLSFRTDANLHRAVAFDVNLASSVLVEGEWVTGELALRSGHDVPFSKLVVSLHQTATAWMGRGDTRTRRIIDIYIPSDALRSGGTVSFRLPTDGLVPSNRNGQIDVKTALGFALAPPYGSYFTLDILPAGSTAPSPVNAARPPLGVARMQRHADAVTAHTGLERGRLPTLGRGRDGAIDVTIADASSGASCMAVEHHRFPDVGLGLRSHPRGALSLAPSVAPLALTKRWVIDARETWLDREIVRAFLTHILQDAANASALEIGDRHLTIWHPLTADHDEDWIAVGSLAKERGRRIAEAIGALPFPDESVREAWSTAAALESAFLLPHLPALALVRRSAGIASGEQRQLTATITTRRASDSTEVAIAFDAPLTPKAIAELREDPRDEGLRALRATYSSIYAESPQHVVAIAKGVVVDPRPLLDTLETFLDWHLRRRSERRGDGPYR